MGLLPKFGDSEVLGGEMDRQGLGGKHCLAQSNHLPRTVVYHETG